MPVRFLFINDEVALWSAPVELFFECARPLSISAHLLLRVCEWLARLSADAAGIRRGWIRDPDKPIYRPSRKRSQECRHRISAGPWPLADGKDEQQPARA